MRKITHALGLLLAVASLSMASAVEPPVVGQTTAPATTTQPPAATQPLVTIIPGNLPLLLTAPHGGRLEIPGAPERTGKGVAARRGAKTNFTFAWDKHSDKLTLELADEIERRTGKRPYVVIANFSRKLVDANRSPEDGVESPAGLVVYDEYHNAIVSFRKQILARWGRGLMVDIHGHGGDPVALIRGTADKQTVRHLLEEFGETALLGDEGLLGPIEAAGVKIVPPTSRPTARENPALNGGYTVRTYGSFSGGNFDAIQLETGGAQRAPENIPTFARQLADGLVPFANLYLLNPDQGAATTRRMSTRSSPSVGDGGN